MNRLIQGPTFILFDNFFRPYVYHFFQIFQTLHLFSLPSFPGPTFIIVSTLQMFAGIYGESTFRTCKNDRETLYRGKPQ